MARYTEDSTIQLVAGAAERMLEEYAAAPTVKARVKNLLKEAAGRSVPERDVIFWPAGMLLLGLLEAGQTDACRSYLDAWIADGMLVRHTDDALTGYVLVRLYEATGEAAYKDAADVIYQFLLDARTDKKGAIVYNAARDNAWIYADGIGQTAMFLSHYGTVFHKAEALALAAMQISLFSQYGMDAATGLPYHGYEACSRMKYGVIGWGRAVGWLLLGTSQYAADCEARKREAESAKAAPGQGTDAMGAASVSAGANAAKGNVTTADAGNAGAPVVSTGVPADYDSRTGNAGTTGTVAGDTPHGAEWLGITDCARDAAVISFHKTLLDSVLRYARRDGTYSWLLPASEGPQDSSATGMIVYSMVKVMRAGTPTEDEENQIADLATSLRDFINGDRVYSCSAECFDFGQYRQQYGCYPWGQGAVLAALAIS